MVAWLDRERRFWPFVHRWIPDGNRRRFIGRCHGRFVHVIDVFVGYDGGLARKIVNWFSF